MNPWNTKEPPKDGTPIVAIGRVIWSDDLSTSVDPFLSVIRWFNDSSGYEGWHYQEGLSVIRTLGDEVIVDYWAQLPKEEGK